MSNVYKLAKSPQVSNFIEVIIPNTPFFIEKYWEWKHVDLSKYTPLVFTLYRNQDNVRNFKSDFYIESGSFLIFSENACTVLKTIIESTGQILPIITESKRKHFHGFYPNKNVYSDSIINLERSDWRQAERGKIISKVVLNSTYPKDDYLFVLEDEPMAVYVTDKFKNLVESNNLVGFDFSRKIEISD